METKRFDTQRMDLQYSACIDGNCGISITLKVTLTNAPVTVNYTTPRCTNFPKLILCVYTSHARLNSIRVLIWNSLADTAGRI